MSRRGATIVIPIPPEADEEPHSLPSGFFCC
jgi:hypothetical protein